jgi:hypothetical protein
VGTSSRHLISGERGRESGRRAAPHNQPVRPYGAVGGHQRAARGCSGVGSQEQKRELIRDQVRETPERSNRQIATTLGGSHPTVASVRDELESTGKVFQSDAREGADGRVINTSNIGRSPSPRRAPDPDFADDDVEDVSQEPEEERAGPEWAYCPTIGPAIRSLCP